MNTQGGLFDSGDTQRARLDALYYPLVKKRLAVGKKVEARDLTVIALRRKVLPMLPRLEANIQLGTYKTRDYLNSIDEATGYQKGYKTPERGRVPPAEVTQTEMEFDIRADCDGAVKDKRKIGRKVTTYWFRYKCRPPDVPQWIWSDEDDNWIKQRIPRSSGDDPSDRRNAAA